MGTSQLETGPESRKGQTLRLGTSVINLAPEVVGGTQALHIVRNALITQNQALHLRLAELGLPYIGPCDIPRCITVLESVGDVALHLPTDQLRAEDGRAWVSGGFTLLRPALPRCQGMLQLLTQKTARLRMDELNVPEEYEIRENNLRGSYLLYERWDDRWSGAPLFLNGRLGKIHMQDTGLTYLGSLWQHWQEQTGYDTLPAGAVYTGPPASIQKAPLTGPEACYLDTTFAVLAYYLGFGDATMWDMGDSNCNRRIMAAEQVRAYGCYGHGMGSFSAVVSPDFEVQPTKREFGWGSALRTEQYYYPRPSPEHRSWSRRYDTEWGYDFYFVRPGSVFDRGYPGHPTEPLNLVPPELERTD